MANSKWQIANGKWQMANAPSMLFLSQRGAILCLQLTPRPRNSKRIEKDRKHKRESPCEQRMSREHGNTMQLRNPDTSDNDILLANA